MAQRRTKSLARKKGPALPGVQARRLDEVEQLLKRDGGASVYEIADELGISVRTAWRRIQALGVRDRLVHRDSDGRRAVWHLTGPDNFKPASGQALALNLCRGLLDFLKGTAIDSYLDEVLAKLSGRQERAKQARKILVVTEGRLLLSEKDADVVNEVVSALAHNSPLRLRHRSIDKGATSFQFDPYTLVVYKRALYILGRSHHHAAIRRLALDAVLEAEWVRGTHFDYPEKFKPTKYVTGPFGLRDDGVTTIRARFTEKAAPYVKRRVWHPTQRLRDLPTGAVEMTVDVPDTREFVSWLMEWGPQVELLSPPKLRAEFAGQLEEAAAQYRQPAGAQQTLPGVEA